MPNVLTGLRSIRKPLSSDELSAQARSTRACDTAVAEKVLGAAGDTGVAAVAEAAEARPLSTYRTVPGSSFTDQATAAKSGVALRSMINPASLLELSAHARSISPPDNGTAERAVGAAGTFTGKSIFQSSSPCCPSSARKNSRPSTGV